MKIVRRLLSLTLVFRIGVLAYLSNTHVGYHHSLVPVEVAICAIDCEEEDHRSAGYDCVWFQTNRFTKYVGALAINSQIHFESETIQWSDQILHLTASLYSYHWDRGPPVV